MTNQFIYTKPGGTQRTIPNKHNKYYLNKYGFHKRWIFYSVLILIWSDYYHCFVFCILQKRFSFYLTIDLKTSLTSVKAVAEVGTWLNENNRKYTW